MEAEPGPVSAEPSVQLNIASAGGTVMAAQYGDLYVSAYYWRPAYRIDPFPAAAPLPAPDEVRSQPSRLLAARHRAVPFTGRTDELTQLAAWRDAPDAALAVLLVYGPAGQGKTRLAAHFAELSAQAGWTIAQANHHRELPAPSSGASLTAQPPTVERGMVLVVDYAERWPTDDLLELARDRMLHLGVPTRVLLLARRAGLWWQALAHHLDNLSAHIGLLRLPPLANDALGRREVFRAAAERFADLLGVTDATDIAWPDRLDGEEYSEVLVIHMAALAAVHAPAAAQSDRDPAALSAYLLGREHAHWRAMYDNNRIVTRPETMAKAVFVATLAGPLPHGAAASALNTAAVSSLADAGQILHDHAVCYPQVDSNTFLQPLYLDRLGEDFLALQCPGHVVDGYEPDDGAWTTAAVERLLKVSGPEPAAWIKQAMTVMVEAARRWKHLFRGQLGPLLRHSPKLAGKLVGSATLTALADMPDIDIDLLESIDMYLPDGGHVAADPGALKIAQRLTALQIARTPDLATHAFLYTRLGVRLAGAGLDQEALEATQKAASLYQQLARTQPEAFEPNAATALNNQAALLSRLGRPADALASAQEAVSITRRLAQKGPHTYDALLADSLVNVANEFASDGRTVDALAATEEAVEKYRRLAAANPKTFEPQLAKALNNLGVWLAETSRRDEALSATQLAVAIDRRLAAADPPAAEAELAGALTNLVARLSEFGRYEEAVIAAEESIAIFQRLVAVSSAAYEPRLASAWLNHSAALAAVGRREDGLAAAEMAVNLFSRLAAASPRVHEPSLARALYVLAIRLSDLGRKEEGLAAAQDALAIRQQLAAVNPSAFGADAAAGWDNVGGRLAELGLWDKALPAMQNAVDVYRGLAATDPDAFASRLAEAQSNRGAVLARVGRTEEAVEATADAVAAWRRSGTTSAPQLGMALNNLSALLNGTGQRQEALSVGEEATAIYRKLAATNPAKFEPDLAMALANLSNAHCGLGNTDEALAAAEQSVAIRRRLAALRPQVFEADLALSLAVLARACATGRVRLPEALIAVREATAIYQRLAAQRPGSFGGYLQAVHQLQGDLVEQLGRQNTDQIEDSKSAGAENIQAAQAHPFEQAHSSAERAARQAAAGWELSNAGQHRRALAHTAEAVRLYRRLAATDPEMFEESLASALTNIVRTHFEVGNEEQALAAANEAVEIRRRLAQANPALHEPGLASALINLSNVLSLRGRWGEALPLAEHAVTLRQGQADADKAHEPDLAGALATLGGVLLGLGRREEALTRTRHAAGIFIRIARSDPARFDPDLAATLSNIGSTLSSLGPHDEALTAAELAVALYRRLAAAIPQRIEADFAMALNNLGRILSDLGRRQEALAAIDEAIAIQQRVAEANPAREQDLAGSLNRIAIEHSMLGQADQALPIVERAVAIRRRLAAADTARQAPFAGSLINLGIVLAQVGRHRDALAATGQAVDIFRALVAAGQSELEPELALSLGAFAQVRMSAVLQLSDALTAVEESIAIYRRLNAQQPNAYVQDIEKGLWTRRCILDRLGRP